MGGLVEACEALTEALGDLGVTVYGYVPAQITPPTILTGFGDPYLSQDVTFDPDEFVCHFELFVIVPTATNAVMRATLNGLIQKVINNLGDWSIDNVAAPYMASANESVYLTCKINVSKLFTLDIEE